MYNIIGSFGRLMSEIKSEVDRNWEEFQKTTKEQHEFLGNHRLQTLCRAILTDNKKAVQTEVTKGMLKSSTEVLNFYIPYTFGSYNKLGAAFSHRSSEVGILYVAFYSLNLYNELIKVGATKEPFMLSLFLLKPGSNGGTDMNEIHAMYSFKNANPSRFAATPYYGMVETEYSYAQFATYERSEQSQKGQNVQDIDYSNFSVSSGNKK